MFKNKINDIEPGAFPPNIGAPIFGGFEDIGIGDNLVFRKLR